MIDYLPGNQPEPDASGTVEFVGGPRSGEREQLDRHVASIPAAGGCYQRSLTCADDGVLRYVWVSSAGARS
jgi:hypothetical protein